MDKNIVKNITTEEEYKILYEDSNKILEYIALHNDINKILNKIVQIVETRFESCRCSILTLDPKTKQLHTAAAPNLPSFYNEAVNGLTIGLNIGSCGTAAFTRKRVITQNIDKDEKWKNYLDLTRKANLHSCLSEPILSSNGEVKGTFGIYGDKSRTPSDFELTMIKNFAYLISIAFEKDDKNKELIEKNNELDIFKQAIENINSGVVITSSKDKQQNIIYVNKAFEKNTGYKKEEVIGKNCRFLQKKDRDQKAIKEIKEAIINQKPCQVEIKNYRKNGEMFYNLLNIAPLFTSNNKVKYFVGMQNDITEIKQHERMMLEQSKMVAMGEMIGNIAHQWRQPLSVITTSASGIMLQKEYNLLTDEILKEHLENIETNAYYLSTTIDTFRDFLKEEKVYQETVLQDRIDKALEIIYTSLKNNHIKLINNIDYSNPIKITLVLGELSQVIINILNNSKDILIEKDIKNSWIKIDLEDYKDKVIITIEDNGGGIPEDIIGKVFEAYFTTKHESQGTGLGLNMSYKIITDSLNGSLYVRNTQNGAKFFIELPKE